MAANEIARLFILPFFGLIGMNIVIFIYGYAAGCFQVINFKWLIVWLKQAGFNWTDFDHSFN